MISDKIPVRLTNWTSICLIFDTQTENNSPAMSALWERNINHTIAMDVYENSKDNVKLLVLNLLEVVHLVV